MDEERKKVVLRCEATMWEDEAQAMVEFIDLTAKMRGPWAGIVMVKAMDLELTQTGLKLPCGYVPRGLP